MTEPMNMCRATSGIKCGENYSGIKINMLLGEMIWSFEGDKTNTMLLAMDGDEIAGLSTITSSHKIKSRHIAELGIVVAKKYHGNGIGTSLIHL